MPQTIMQKTSSDGLIISGCHEQKSGFRHPGDPDNATYRLASFSKYPDVPILPKLLADAGFYFVGQDGITQCYSCGSCVGKWHKDDDPRDSKYHKTYCTANNRQGQQLPRSPTHESVSHADRPPLPEARQETATSATEPNSTNRPETTNQDNQLGGAQESEHNRASLAATFTLDNPFNRHMRSEEARLATFQNGENWQRGRIAATPDQLVKAGFFYLGHGDRVKCYYCNGGLEAWEYHDDPWIEHAKWYPNCEFTLRHKGPDFVADVTSQYPNLNRPRAAAFDIPPSAHYVYNNYGSSIPPPSRFSGSRGAEIVDPREEDRKRERLIASTMDNSSLVKEARKMGFTNENIRRSLQKQYQMRDRDFATLDELLDTVNNLEAEESTENQATRRQTNEPIPISENPSEQEERMRLLEEERKCKVCLDNEANVVFVPCGHLSTCVTCSQRVSNCPICRAYVRQKIKTYIS